MLYLFNTPFPFCDTKRHSPPVKPFVTRPTFSRPVNPFVMYVVCVFDVCDVCSVLARARMWERDFTKGLKTQTSTGVLRARIGVKLS